MNNDRLDSAWNGWDQVLRSILNHLKRNDFKTALTEVDAFLVHEKIPEVRSSALGMKGDLQADLGDLEGARETLLSARALVGPSFGRYVHELSLAETYRKEKRLDEAALWYRNALRTSVEAKISGGGALKKFLDLRTMANLSEEDRELCLAVATQSWNTLGLSGEPNLGNLTGVALALMEAESRPPKRS